MSNGTRTRGAPTRVLTLVLGLVLLAALGAGAAALGAGAPGEPPERLDEAELLSRVTAAPENAPDFRATATFEQTLVPEGLLGASEGDTGDSGPRTVRVWRGGPDQFRAELQGDNGDRLLVRNGPEVSIYDGATNTLKTGEKPEGSDESVPGAVASPEEIDELLAEISPTSELRAGEPVRIAGRWAYPLTLEPKDKSLTLVERAETLVDAETFVPLSFELYVEDTPEPVVRYEAQDFEVGPVPDGRFELETPPGAKVETLEPRGGGDGPGRDREGGEPQKVASVEEARELVDFPVAELADAPGGRELSEVAVAGDGVVLAYGSGWGTVVLAQKPDRGGNEAQGSTGEEQTDELQVPTVSLGGGVEAREVSTPVGTVLTWEADGVSYSLAGSVPAAELEGTARGLVR